MKRNCKKSGSTRTRKRTRRNCTSRVESSSVLLTRFRATLCCVRIRLLHLIRSENIWLVQCLDFSRGNMPGTCIVYHSRYTF